MRGCVSEERLREINARLPVLKGEFASSTFPDFTVVLNDIDKGTSLELALICLGDAIARFGYCNLALHEAFATLAWYRDESPKAPQEFEAILVGKFYADYVPLILYAGAEDVADFIAYFLGVKDDILKFLGKPEIKQELRNKQKSSYAAKIALYMNHRYPGHEITRIIDDLHKNGHWRAAMEYRNTWVHEKPPIVAGLGIQFERKSQKKLEAGRWVFPIGTGSAPKYGIDQLVELAHQATYAFAAALNALIEIAERERPTGSQRFMFSGLSNKPL